MGGAKVRLSLLSLAAILLILSLLLPGTARAVEATLEDIIVTNTSEDLVVFFEIHGCFTQEMEDAILNGIPTTFTIFVELARTRSFWLDETISEFTLEHTIIYDRLKNQFKVRRSEDGSKELIFTDFAAAKEAMAEVRNVKVAPLRRLEKDSRYQLRLKAELEKVRLPLYLHYVLFFVSLWDFETDWYAIDFVY